MSNNMCNILIIYTNIHLMFLSGFQISMCETLISFSHNYNYLGLELKLSSVEHRYIGILLYILI